MPRDVTIVIPPVFIALFFFIVNIGTLKRTTASIPNFNYTAFEIATAILLGVTMETARLVAQRAIVRRISGGGAS